MSEDLKVDIKNLDDDSLDRLQEQVHREILARSDSRKEKIIEQGKKEMEDWIWALRDYLPTDEDVSFALRVMDTCGQTYFSTCVKTFIDAPDEDVTWDMITWDVVERALRDVLTPNPRHPEFHPDVEQCMFLRLACLLHDRL